MLVDKEWYQTLWEDTEEKGAINIIDQRDLPHAFTIRTLSTVQDCYRAIQEMWVRGAPLIGVTAAYGAWFAAKEAQIGVDPPAMFVKILGYLKKSRPTAVNLFYALDRVQKAVEMDFSDMTSLALNEARTIRREEIERSRAIGKHGYKLLKDLAKNKKKKGPLNILTHCNAGWLACIDYGTATAPIYEAFQQGLDVHVWVDETRPRNQGASLTAWELGQMGVPHTLIADNTGGLLMQQGKVDAVLVGSDRTTANGDVANKIGTYLKALAAKDNQVPFYVALPTSTIDMSMHNGLKEMPIEERSADEVTHMSGITNDGEIARIRIAPENTAAANYAFDVTPARLVTSLITEAGVCEATKPAIADLMKTKEQK
ncbi:MAG: S-methyl-5-thioribose-1-phosphate isomerase [Bacteroidota bacterium]